MLVVLALSLVLFVGCGGRSTPSATASTTPAPVALATRQPIVTPTPAAPTATAAPTLTPTTTASPTASATPTTTPTLTPTPLSRLSVDWLRQQSFPGSDLVVEQKLEPGRNYTRAVASYRSDGLKIYGLLTIPIGAPPATGWPIIIFNHGYIPPDQYRTTERYVAYQDAFAASGYITFKSDYRGHGSSEGRAASGFGTVDYTIDVLNALNSVKRLKEADPNRIGLWGHSMGGSITLRAMVTVPEIKAGVIWAGVVASYEDQLERARRQPTGLPTSTPPAVAPTRGWRSDLTAQYGTVDQNPAFYASISPNNYLKEISGPLQLQHGTADTSVPVEYSDTLTKQMQAAGKMVEYFKYPGDDHNLATNLAVALQRAVAFFDKYVKSPQK